MNHRVRLRRAEYDADYNFMGHLNIVTRPKHQRVEGSELLRLELVTAQEVS